MDGLEVEKVQHVVNGNTNETNNNLETNGDPQQQQQKQKQTKDNKNKNKKKKKKSRAAKQRSENERSTAPLDEDENDNTKDEESVEVEYVTADEPDLQNPTYAAFASVFEFFKKAEKGPEKVEVEETVQKPETKEEKEDDDEDDEDGKQGDTKKVSKKKLRRLNRLSVAELKRLTKKPEVVEWVDVTANDPLLLTSLKSIRNSVPVPRHWSQKRKYLQGKRGIVKPPFELPDFIKGTGISEMREAVKEKEEQLKMKAKMRERVQPKMGKLEIDYQKLHDAFFRYQTKPFLTIHGDLYYEGKEFEVKVKEKRPGNLSAELKAALGIPPGAPPPWLINMQRYGPPPSYPSLKIPGLNAPIPEGAQWGYHPGGWGKPPVDEFGQPLYGDVFGQMAPPPPEVLQPVEKKIWGEFEEEEHEEEEEEEEEDEDEDDGLETPSGMSSIASGLETPDTIELRKDIRRGDETPGFEPEKTLYTVIPQREIKSGSGFLGSHAYDLSVLNKKSESVQVSFDPTEIESLDEESVKKLYQEQKEAKDKGEKHDLSDMVAEHAAQQSKKRKKQDSKSSKKELKF